MKLEDIDREFKEMAQSMKDGEAALNRGQYGDAEKLFVRALELVERCYGPDHPDALVCLHHLADACYGLKKHADSLTALKKLLAIKEKHGGAADLELAQVLFKLAKNYEKLGLTRESETFYRRALKKAEETYGTNNSFVATIMESFAAMLRRAQIHLPEAEKLEERVRDIRGNQALPSQFSTSVLTQLAVSIAPGSEESLLLQEKARNRDQLALSGRMRSLRSHAEHADLPAAPSEAPNLAPLAATIGGALLLAALGIGGYIMAVNGGMIKGLPALSFLIADTAPSKGAKPLSAQPRTLIFQTPDGSKRVALINDTEAAVARRGVVIKCAYTVAGDILEFRPKTSESILYTYTRIPEGLTDDESSVLYAADSPEALIINKMIHFAAVLQRYYAANQTYPAKIEYILSGTSSINYNNPFTGKSSFPKKKDLPGDQKDISDFGINDYSLLEAATRQLSQYNPNVKEEPGTIEFYRTAAGPDGDSIYIRCTDRNGRYVRGSQPGSTYLITLSQGQVKSGR